MRGPVVEAAGGPLRLRLEQQRLANLKEEATPGAGVVLSELIRENVVMGTDALLIDENKCIRCSNCVRACEDVHDDGQARLSLTGTVKFRRGKKTTTVKLTSPVATAAKRTVSIKLPAKAAAALKAKLKLSASLTLAASNANGSTTTKKAIKRLR